MKNSHKLLTLIAAAAALVTSAFANTVTFGPNNANYRQGHGGEFTLVPMTGDPDHLLNDYPTGVNGTAISTSYGTGFETFCLEKTEYMNFNTKFYYGISTAARGPTHAPDEISVGTSWLYGNFAQGLLAGYTYTAGAARAASAEKLQHAIWYLEGEETYTDAGGAANTFLNAVVGVYGSLTNAKADATGLGMGVAVINLATTQTKANSGIWDAQDQLIWPKVPDQATTIALLGLGLVGLVGFRRKISK